MTRAQRCWVHANTSWKTYLHSRGSIHGYIPAWIEAGCDTQHVLPHGTPDEIREHVRHNMEVFIAPDGGYVYTQVHNIQQDVPVENVEAMLAAAYEFG